MNRRASITSDVRILNTPAAALGSLSALGGPKVAACYNRFLGPYYLQGVPKRLHPKISPLDVAGSTTPGEPSNAVDVHLVFSLSIVANRKTQTEVITDHLVAFVVGRAVIQLQVNEVGPWAGLPIESGLLQALEARAKTLAAL